MEGMTAKFERVAAGNPDDVADAFVFLWEFFSKAEAQRRPFDEHLAQGYGMALGTFLDLDGPPQ